MNYTGYLLVVLSALMGVISQMMLKKSARTTYPNWWREYINLWVIGGYGLMVLSLVVNLLAIHLGVLAQEVSIIECINYLLIPLAAWLCFQEAITRKKLLAIAIIMLGAIVFFLKPEGFWTQNLL